MSWIIPVIAVLAAAYVFWWNHFENKSPESENNENLIAKAQSIMDRSVFKRRGLFIRPMIINQNFQMPADDRKTDWQPQPPASPDAEKPDIDAAHGSDEPETPAESPADDENQKRD